MIMLNEQTFDKLYAMKLIGMAEGCTVTRLNNLNSFDHFLVIIDRSLTQLRFMDQI